MCEKLRSRVTTVLNASVVTLHSLLLLGGVGGVGGCESEGRERWKVSEVLHSNLKDSAL